MTVIEIGLWLTLWTLCCGPGLFFFGAVGTAAKVQADLKAKGLHLQYDPKLQRWNVVSVNDATIQG
jgi:hypothetical protein